MVLKGVAYKFAVILLVIFTLTGCSVFVKTTPAPLPTIVLDSSEATPVAAATTPATVTNDGVTASGIVVPAQEASLAFTMAGKVKAVHVAVGDYVQAGAAGGGTG